MYNCKRLKRGLKVEILKELQAENNAAQQEVSRGEIFRCIREDCEWECRKLYLCTTNIPESAPNSDESTVKNFLADQLKSQEDLYSKIKSLRRVGTSRDNQPRLTLFTLKTSEACRAILRNSSKLEDYRLNDKIVFNKPDLTPM